MQRCAAIFLTLAVPLLAGAADSGPQVRPGIRSPISFTGSPPQSSTAQIKLRLHAAEQPGPYDLSKEKFEILVPKDYMGVNYFRDPTAEDGTLFQIRFLPQLEMANLAVANNRYALITGEKDFNRVNTRTIHDEGFVKDGFKAVKLFDIPAQGHNPPNAEWLAKVIDFLDNGK